MSNSFIGKLFPSMMLGGTIGASITSDRSPKGRSKGFLKGSILGGLAYGSSVAGNKITARYLGAHTEVLAATAQAYQAMKLSNGALAADEDLLRKGGPEIVKMVQDFITKKRHATILGYTAEGAIGLAAFHATDKLMPNEKKAHLILGSIVHDRLL